MNRKAAFVFVLGLLIVFGLTVRLWFLPLMNFVGANTDLIQGFANLVQIFIWIGAGLIVWFGLLRPNQNHQNETPVEEPRPDMKTKHESVKNEATLEGDGAMAQGDG